MPIFSSLKHSIFLRIYAGLLLVCLFVALFAQLLVDTINEERIQAYRENVATGALYLVSSGLQQQSSETQREYWLNDISQLFGNQFSIQPEAKIDFKASELKRLEQNKTVVRYVAQPAYADIFHPIEGEDNVITVRISKVTEQQVRAMAVLLLNDLSYYKDLKSKRQRLGGYCRGAK